MGPRLSPLALGLSLGLALGAGCASAGRDTGGGGPGSNRPDAPLAPIDAPDPIDATPDAPAGSACASAQLCTSAMMLGTVSGDTGNAKLTASGYQSAWFRVRVTEDDSDVFGLSLRVGATLTSPSGATFHPAIYLNTGSDVVECATTVGSSTTAGTTETIHAEWGETGTFSNGDDDGRFASIEVRAPATGCSPTETWQLTVEGDWF